MNDFTVEIERIRGIVGKYFPIYDVRVSYEAVSLFCKIDEYTLEEKFDELRKELLSLNYIPILTQETGEYIIHVTKKMKVRYKSIAVNIALLIATISTTIFAGTMQWGSYIGLESLGEILSSSTIFFGTIFFALPLMIILGVHELGHYFMSKRHGVAASLPFFIPAPPPLLLGTMGAFISLREPIPNRKALFDIGVAGPIAGLLIAIPVTIIGLMLTATGQQPVPQNPGDAGVLYVGTPLIYMLLSYLVPTPENVLIHPTAFAGWVGFLVTAINLLPAGQLDGGHIFYALFGKRAKYMSYVAIIFMIALSFMYMGWFLFALLIIILGTKHPPPLNDITGLDKKRKAIGAVALAILIVCFVPVPFTPGVAVHDFEFETLDMGGLQQQNMTIQTSISNMNITTFYIVNNGNTFGNISLAIETNWSARENLGMSLTIDNKTYDMEKVEKVYIKLNSSERKIITLTVESVTLEKGDYTLFIKGRLIINKDKEIEEEYWKVRSVKFNIEV